MEPLALSCMACGGSGCSGCKQMGEVLINHCPQLELDEEILELIGLAELFQKGLPPVAGGTLDQTPWFLQFARCVFNELTTRKNELQGYSSE